MIYSAKVVQAGSASGQWVVSPQYTRVDGTDAPDQTALAGSGIKPVAGDIVLCADSRNSFDHSAFRIFDNNDGACPIIIAVFSQLLTRDLNLVITGDFTAKGKATLGEGSQKMVLGGDLETWAKAKDAEIAALYTWAATGVAPGPTGGINPFPGTPPETNWNAATLSENHKLD
jgi:hypothetical protein